MKKLNCVLLVDDDEPTNFLHSWIIRQSGFAARVEIAEGAREGLVYLEASSTSDDHPSPDLIFIDLNMPAMNGWEFIEQYRKLAIARQRKTVFVMLTTSMFPEDELKAQQTPELSGYESKPLTPEALLRIQERYFPNSTDDGVVMDTTAQEGTY